jgi:hypothetical protein
VHCVARDLLVVVVLGLSSLLTSSLAAKHAPAPLSSDDSAANAERLTIFAEHGHHNIRQARADFSVPARCGGLVRIHLQPALPASGLLKDVSATAVLHNYSISQSARLSMDLATGGPKAGRVSSPRSGDHERRHSRRI